MKKCGECDELRYTGDEHEGWCPDAKRRVRTDSKCQSVKDVKTNNKEQQ